MTEFSTWLSDLTGFPALGYSLGHVVLFSVVTAAAISLIDWLIFWSASRRNTDHS